MTLSDSDDKVKGYSTSFEQSAPLIGVLLGIAGITPGVWIVTGFGEDQEDWTKLPSIIRHIDNRQSNEVKLTQFRAAFAEIAAVPGMNAYFAPRLFRADLPSHSKGGLADVLFTYAVVLDFDGDHDPATRKERLPHPAACRGRDLTGQLPLLVFPRSRIYVGRAEAGRHRADREGQCLPFQQRSEPCVPSAGLSELAEKVKADAGRKREMSRLSFFDMDAMFDLPSLDGLRAAILRKYPDAFVSGSRDGSNAGGDFDWNQRERSHAGNSPRRHQQVTERPRREDRSDRAFRFMQKAKGQGYSPEEIVELPATSRCMWSIRNTMTRTTSVPT